MIAVGVADGKEARIGLKGGAGGAVGRIVGVKLVPDGTIDGGADSTSTQRDGIKRQTSFVISTGGTVKGTDGAMVGGVDEGCGVIVGTSEQRSGRMAHRTDCTAIVGGIVISGGNVGNSVGCFVTFDVGDADG
mmetsp:Transcript_845/g.1165  ORF Transcript_845/g.1165 Transcript_845/m.1165 type:complete len:133 (+) Transcript_845:322-720(+)